MIDAELFATLVSEYVVAIRANRTVPRALAEPSLYGPLERLLNGFLTIGGPEGARAVQQAGTDFGIPDFVVDAHGVLGYVEAKKPSTDLNSLTGHDRKQQGSLLNLPNVLYTNYRDFQLFEGGQQVASVSLGRLDLFDHRRPSDPSPGGVRDLRTLLTRFASHRIAPPSSVGELALALARATRVLQDATLAALRAAPNGAIAKLREEWRALLFEDASDEQFADAYAQTVAYGMLTARLEANGPLTISAAVDDLDRHHHFLAAALRLLTYPEAQREVGWAIQVVTETLDGVSLDTFKGSKHADDPLLYFYEDFLAEYDKELRKKRGVYYTPASVVGFQVRAIADLADRLGRPRVLADDVVALDPGAGTGTYLLGLLDETIARVRERDGDGAVPAAGRLGARHLNGFEILVGPYTVAHQRLATRLEQLGVSDEEVRVFLVDTLAAPEAHQHQQMQFGIFEQQLSEERQRADKVKRVTEVKVVLGNPPYRRTKGRDPKNWLQQKMSLFTGPVSAAARVNLKNLADPYVHFFRWGLWKLFESTPPSGPRILSFISNRSYLGGDAFEGLRLALRQRFDEIWVVDLEGESRGARASENVFDVRVGVAIIVCLCEDSGAPRARDATVRYVRVSGTRAEKEQVLKGSLADFDWAIVERGGGEPFLPTTSPAWRRWVALDELMPFRQSGVQTKRDALVVAPTAPMLLGRLRAFADPDLSANERREMFHETEARPCPTSPVVAPARIRRLGYRPLDLQYLYDDSEYTDRPRPKLHRYWHDGQRAFCTLPKGHGRGPVVVLQTEIPDLHAFRGSFGGHAFLWWLDPGHREANLAAGLLDRLSRSYGVDLPREDVFAYIFAILNAPTYQPRFADELAQGFPRVPFPADPTLFTEGSAIGHELLGAHELPAPVGKAKLTGQPGRILDRPTWSEQRLRVCSDAYLEPVSKAAWDYAVSSYRVIERWLRARASLDLGRDFDLIDQLRRVTEAVEVSVRMGPQLDSLLDRVLAGETLGRNALLPGSAGPIATR